MGSFRLSVPGGAGMSCLLGFGKGRFYKSKGVDGRSHVAVACITSDYRRN